jgi:mannonate dehydratase
MRSNDVGLLREFSRRELGKVALASTLGATLLCSSGSSSAAVRRQPPGIKLGSAAPVSPTDEDLLFFKQLGVDCVFCAITPEYNSVESLLNIKKRYADAGLVVHNVRNLSVTNNQVDIVLNRPGRDRRIEDYKTWIRTVGKAGFHYTLTTFNLAQIVSSGLSETRGSQTRDCDLNSTALGIPGGIPIAAKGAANSLLFGRHYSPDEIWENYTHFIKQVAPVAEESHVAIGFHPDDPPTPSLFGVPRIFSTFDNCKKALEIANSPNVGMCLCCGTWAEGGAAMGIDPAGAIRHFGSRGQIYEVHFRNVSSSLPHFHETYVDNGYYDMHKVMTTLQDVQYDGIVHLDHFIPMVGGNRTYEAFNMGYMRAMRQRATVGNIS